jgi:hypothetical protein
MAPPLLSLLEAQEFAALRTFILQSIRASEFTGSISGNILTVSSVFAGKILVNQPLLDSADYLQPNTKITGVIEYNKQYTVEPAQRTFGDLLFYGGIEVIRGQQNRVSQPQAQDFIVISPLRQDKLGWNVSTYQDTVINASITGNLLTVNTILQNQIELQAGLVLIDVGGPLYPGTILGPQASGNDGGIGIYNVYPSQNVPNEQMYIGAAQSLIPTQLSTQLDIYGPSSADNAAIIRGLFYSGIAYDILHPLGVAPLYTSNPHELAFTDAEQQYEYRWTMDLESQINPVITTTQQFADKLIIGAVPVDLVFPADFPSTTTSSLYINSIEVP